MSATQQPSSPDILDAFRRAILVTQATVEPGTTTATELAKMLEITTKMQVEAHADEAAARLLESFLGWSRRAAHNG